MLPNILRGVFLTALVVLLTSCSNKDEAVSQAELETPPKAQSILVIPSQVAVQRGATKESAKSKEAQIGAEYMTTLLKSELSSRENVQFASNQTTNNSVTEIKGGIFGTIKSFGEAYGADVVLYSTVSRFKQREGDGAAADYPASVAFEMRLVRVDTGVVLWSSTFSETQEDVFSNIFSIGKASSRGFRWITAEEMMEQAVKEKIEDCSYF